MPKTYAIGDIHGGFNALKELIEKLPLQTQDTLIFLGDYVDGWSDSPKVISYLMQLKNNYTCIFIKGNHDQLLLDYFKNNSMPEQWLHHGGKSTINAYKNIDSKTKKQHQEFLENLTPYHIDAKNRLFVHAGFTNIKGPSLEYFPEMLHWDRTLWETALVTSNSINLEQKIYPKRLLLFSEIYIGHTPTTRIDQFKPMKAANVWNIDTGAAFKGSLSAIEIGYKTIFQSSPVYKLYPNEKGRN